MSTSTLTLPGHSLFAQAPLFATLTAAIGSTGAAIWHLFHMSAGLNSVDPELLAHRIVQD